MLTEYDIEHSKKVNRLYNIYKANYKNAGLRYLYGEENQRTDVIEVIENLPQKICRVFASMMFLEEYTLSINNQGAEQIDSINEILYRNKFQKLLLQSAHSQSYAGFTAFEVSLFNGKVLISLVKPDYLFIDPNPISPILPPKAIKIGWYFEQNNQKYLYLRTHTTQNITNVVYLCDSMGMATETSFDPRQYGFDVEREQEQFEAGIPVFVIHNDIHEIGEVYGTSDFDGNETLFQELARNASQISNELHHFGNAMLAVPPGVLDSRTGRPKVSGGKMIQIDSEEHTFVPQYIVNSNPQIDKAQMNAENVLRSICRSTDIAEILVGLNTQGGAEKVGALRLRLLLTLARVKAKLQGYHAVLPHLVSFVAKVEGKNIEHQDVYFEFHDGLPNDMVEMVDNEVKRYSAGLQSLSDAIKNLDNLGEDELKAKIEEIRENESRFALPPITNH